MAQIEVKRVRATATVSDQDPQWEVVVDYGHGIEVCIPLPAHCLATDDVEMQQRLSLEAMESLGKALLRFADQIRKRWPPDWG
jgi:hypothetical protein